MRLSFRLTLLGVLVLLVVATAAAIGWINYSHGRVTAEILSRQILEQTSHRVEERVSELLGGAVTQAELARRLLETGSLPADDLERIARYFAEALATEGELSYLSYTDEDTGAYAHAYRDSDGAITLRMWAGEDGEAGVFEDYRIGEDGELALVERLDPPEGHDYRRRPYYEAAIEAGGDTWTDTYVFLGDGGDLDVPGVTRAALVGGQRGEPLGVISADFEFSALSRYLDRLDVGEEGYAFVVEYRGDGSRRIIAHPRPELIVPEGAEEPTEAGEIDDPTARAFAEAMPTRASELAPGEVAPLELTAGDEPFFGTFTRLAGGEPAWGVAVVIPEDDVMAPVIASRDATLKASAVAFVLTLGIAIWLASGLGRALREVSRETEEVGRLQFAEKPPIRSVLAEVDRLGSAVEEMKAGLRSFEKFVPSEVVRAIVGSGREAALGSDRRELTVFFSDIAGFTPIAERLPAEELVALLGAYLGAMTKVIHDERGAIDKYMGDGIMAFWNAPEPVEDHPARAMEAALACRDRLRGLRERWKARGWPDVSARIGIHTGEAVVGNFGSEQRFDYTAMGDTVNLASRLEALNKDYGTEILISEDTRRGLGEAYVVRALDKVSVRGKDRGTTIYEVIGRAGEVGDDELARARAYEDALAAYFERRFADAAAAFDSARARWPDDEAARVMAERSRALEASPPPPEWDGVHRN